MKLDELYTIRTHQLNELEQKIIAAEKFLKDLKNDHAKALNEFNRVNVYKLIAKRQKENDEKLFKWVTTTDYQESNIQKYVAINRDFTLRIKHRKELKVWRYEVYVSSQKRSYTDYTYHDMHQRKKENNSTMWGDSKFKEIYGDELESKFKTLDEAKKHVEKWKTRLLKDFKKEIDIDKNMYKQACKKYDNVVRIELDRKNRQAFDAMLPFFTDIKVLNDDYPYIELTGDNAKETIDYLINHYKMNIRVLAG